MACSEEFIRYLCRQLEGAGEIAARKMFGEYGVYCDGKIIGLACDNQFFLKKTKAGEAVWPGLPEAAPYAGAKPHLLLEDLEDGERLAQLVRAAWTELPMPKPKKPKMVKTSSK